MRRNCLQVEPAAPRCGRDPRPLQHPPHGGGADPDAEAEQLAQDPPVAPARVLPCHPLDQRRNLGIHGRPAAPAGIRPSPPDQPPVPAQERSGRDQAAHPQRSGEQPGQGGKHCPVGPVQLRSGVLPPQHRHLMAQDEQLSILGGRRAREQSYPAGHADEDQVEHPGSHEPVILPAPQPSPQTNQQVSRLCPVLEPYTRCPAVALSALVSNADAGPAVYSVPPGDRDALLLRRVKASLSGPSVCWYLLR